jgi:hypothetical protein
MFNQLALWKNYTLNNLPFPASNIFDFSQYGATVPIEVHDPISLTDQIEVVCPNVVLPGTYFLCKADIPRGTKLTANITITDDIDGMKESTGNMPIPGECMECKTTRPKTTRAKLMLSFQTTNFVFPGRPRPGAATTLLLRQLQICPSTRSS